MILEAQLVAGAIFEAKLDLSPINFGMPRNSLPMFQAL
jgi:hypothetical protein